jgi:hypothetical protein
MMILKVFHQNIANNRQNLTKLLIYSLNFPCKNILMRDVLKWKWKCLSNLEFMEIETGFILVQHSIVVLHFITNNQSLITDIIIEGTWNRKLPKKSNKLRKLQNLRRLQKKNKNNLK